MSTKSRVSILARRNAIRRSQGATDSELIGNALPPCHEKPEEIPGYLTARHMEQGIKKALEETTR